MKKMLKVLILFLVLAGGGQSCMSMAAELGPNPPTVFKYGALGGTAVDNEVQVTGLAGMRRSWHPVDLVGEVVIRERSAVHLLAAKQFGDTRILGGVGLNSGAGAGIVVGVDYNDYMIRVGEYRGSRSYCNWKRCRKYRTNHAALFVGRVWNLGSK